jgi:lysophospholipase L1-like esterase
MALDPHGRRRSSVPLLLLPVVAVLILTLLVASRPAPELQPVPPDTRPRAIVALGDSIMSGEGAGDYAPGTRGENGNFCHRSANALVYRLDVPGVTERINLACSGADAADVGFAGPNRSPGSGQAERLGQVAQRYRVVAVVVAVGANDDPHFADTMLRCIQAWARQSGPSCSDVLAPQWPRRLDAMAPGIAGALADVRTAMRRAGYSDGDYELVLTSYPSPLTEDIVGRLRDLSGCPFRTEDLAWIRTQAVPQLAAALGGVAERAGARFLDLSQAAGGHEACTSPGAPSREWINRLRVDFELLRREETGHRALAESFHPNATGHLRIAGCLEEFLRGQRRAARCVIDADGALHPRPIRNPAAR